MIDPWKGIAAGRLPDEGEVAYFVHLHLDTAQATGKHSCKEAVWVYSIEGKARPMLVLRRLPKCERGRRQFLVVRITTKGRDESGRTYDGHEPIGNCIDPHRESFVVLEPQKLPENLLYSEDGGHPVVKPFNPLAFRSMVKVVAFKVNQGVYSRNRAVKSGTPGVG